MDTVMKNDKYSDQKTRGDKNQEKRDQVANLLTLNH